MSEEAKIVDLRDKLSATVACVKRGEDIQRALRGDIDRLRSSLEMYKSKVTPYHDQIYHLKMNYIQIEKTLSKEVENKEFWRAQYEALKASIDKTPDEATRYAGALPGDIENSTPKNAGEWKEKFNSVVIEVTRERALQQRKWAQQNHSLCEWIAILTEELGEAAKEAVDYTTTSVPMGVRANQIWDYRTELLQLAAVAIQAVESVDRNERAQFTIELKKLEGKR